MDVLDSPLNLAHQHGRKADKLLNANKYDDAIECHQKAKACLAQAMLTTTDKKALESLRLQQSKHDQQQALVCYKQKTADLSSHASIADKINTNKVNTIVTKPENSRYNGQFVQTTMHECDTLLHFLDDRLGTNKPTPKECGDTSAVIEELQVNNEALREHICELVKECESQHHLVEYFQTENAKLRDRVAQLERTNLHHVDEFDHKVALPLDMNVDDLASLPLAPLEMPHFDFDSLTPRKVDMDGQSEQDKAT